MKKKLFYIIGLLCLGMSLYSQVRTHHVFDDNMVLQRDKPVKIWGWATQGEKITIEFADQLKTTVTLVSGEWHAYLDPLTASSKPKDLKITGESGSEIFSNIVVGDVWLLGGQSNMEFDLHRIFNGDLEIEMANFPNLRLLTLPRNESREPAADFERVNEYDGWYDRYDKKGYWFICSPGNVETFSGLGYIFGSRVHMASGIPIGLIDVSRGGTTLEAWLSPDMLADMPENEELLKKWNDRVEEYDPVENLKQRIQNWEKRTESRKKQGLEPGPKPTEPSPSPALDYNFPGSSYNGFISPIKGLSVKGAIFHHGYNNALLADSRPILYASNFKALIKDWRKAFNDEELPFGIIELSAGGAAQTLENFEARMVDAAPFIREGQYLAYAGLNNVAYVCAYDQQVNWYHPQKKTAVGERTARWALSEFYNINLPWEPAAMKSYDRKGETMIISFDRDLKSSDDRPFEGFAIAGKNQHFYPADAQYFVSGTKEGGQAIYDKKRIVVSSPFVTDPLAVRYAWARNPLGNLVNTRDRIIPLPPFRTDTWNYPEAPYDPDELRKHREKLKSLSRQAEEWTNDRILNEAKYILKNK